MRGHFALGLATVALLVPATPAQASDVGEVRFHLDALGAERIRSITCDATRYCTARYAYVNRGPRKIGLDWTTVTRCRGWFRVSNGVDDLGDGYVWEYAQVEQYQESCMSDRRSYRTLGSQVEE